MLGLRQRGGCVDIDAKICYCFHVSRRKLENFVRRERPRVASQLSQCGGAGTGCGWCIPFLKQIFAVGGQETEALNQLTPEEYARQRALYIRSGKGTPPAGATPLPDGNVGDSANPENLLPGTSQVE
jgi:bacterioferritin-associated ferredoxin